MLFVPVVRRLRSHKLFLTVAALAAGAPALGGGCYAPALQQAPSNNAAFVVDYLFTHDGCRVYRFTDRSPHYFVNCSGGSSATISPVSCGKNCVEDELIISHQSPARAATSPESETKEQR